MVGRKKKVWNARKPIPFNPRRKPTLAQTDSYFQQDEWLSQYHDNKFHRDEVNNKAENNDHQMLCEDSSSNHSESDNDSEWSAGCVGDAYTDYDSADIMSDGDHEFLDNTDDGAPDSTLSQISDNTNAIMSPQILNDLLQDVAVCKLCHGKLRHQEHCKSSSALGRSWALTCGIEACETNKIPV